MALVLRFLKFLKVCKGQFSIGMIGLLYSTLTMLFMPLIIQYLIDTQLTQMMNGTLKTYDTLLMILAGFILMMTSGSVIGYFAMRVLMHCANVVAEHIRNDAFDTMQNLPIRYFDDKPAGKISSRIVNDTETLRSGFYGQILTQVMINLLLLIMTYALLMYLNLFLGMALLTLIPIFILWQYVYTKLTEKALNRYYEARGEVNSLVNETMNGSTIIQLFGQEDKIKSEFLQTSTDMKEADNKNLKVEASMSWGLVDVVKRFTQVAMLSVFGYAILYGRANISAGIIFSYVTYVTRIFDYLGSLVRLFPNVSRSLSTGKRVFELLDAPIEAEQSDQMVVTDGDVTFEDVSFGYHDTHYVLKNITIHAKKGETIALVGHTGSGKSSIMNLLFRFYDPQEGKILIDGQNIQLFNRESVRRDMGIVLQDPYLFTGTIATNVSMNNASMPRNVILNALEKVGAQDMLSRLEKGIDEPVVEKGNAFSSGERQLISFARTLANDPKILILDEATSHIDTETEEIIQNAMDVVREGRTTFIIAHRLSTIQNADQILVLHEGEIVERGQHQSLLALNGRYAQMYHMQKKNK